jgi:Flp pilus assembly pilin Flp
MKNFKHFLKDDAGAVTVDWVVLTSGVVILAVIVLPPIQSAIVEVATNIGVALGVAGDWLPSNQ